MIVTVASVKGGSGKTTTAVSLAVALAAKGRKVLLVDFDPAGHATEWLATPESYNRRSGMYRAEGIDILPATPDLQKWDRRFGYFPKVRQSLRQELQRLSGEYFILIDTPPHQGDLTVFALEITDGVLIPMEAHVMALRGLEKMVQTVSKPYRVLLCRFNQRSRHSQLIYDDVRHKLPGKVFKQYIHESVWLAEAPLEKKSIFAYAPESATAEDYSRLVPAILEWTDTLQGKGGGIHYAD